MLLPKVDVLTESRGLKIRQLLLLTLVPGAFAAQDFARPPAVLPAPATTALTMILREAAPHRSQVWRDTAPINADDTVNAYIEIAKGDRRKWEFDMGRNVRAIDRIMPVAVGGYPVNYGFMPQTVSYDGDPFDVLVLGPPLQGGALVRGVIVGVMFMEDEKGLDSKVVLSRIDARGRPVVSVNWWKRAERVATRRDHYAAAFAPTSIS